MLKAAYLGSHMEYTVASPLGELFVVDPVVAAPEYGGDYGGCCYHGYGGGLSVVGGVESTFLYPILDLFELEPEFDLRVMRVNQTLAALSAECATRRSTTSSCSPTQFASVL